MLETLADDVKRSLRAWTDSLAGDRAEALRSLGRPSNEFGVDRYGFDVDYLLAAAAPLIWLYKNYFRVETHGIEKVPAGRVLLVANHAGQLPIDGAMIGVAMLLEANPPRAVRSMAEKWAPTLPYVSTVLRQERPNCRARPRTAAGFWRATRR